MPHVNKNSHDFIEGNPYQDYGERSTVQTEGGVAPSDLSMDAMLPISFLRLPLVDF
jgi:hypothetical protein